MSEWQTMETAPRDGTVFLAVNMRGNKDKVNYEFVFSIPENMQLKFAPDAGWRSVGRDWPAYPTHWIPLPEPPTVTAATSP